MIHGVGIDLVQTSRIAAALERFGERFAQRILTDHEHRRFRQARRRVDFLAKHFAAKEAFMKALGTGLRQGVSWRDIEIRNEPLGRPYLHLTGRVRELLEYYEAGECHLSLCDEGGYAAANVTLLKRVPLRAGPNPR
ncbi:MAG: holo-ACP synthase [Gammaproteobacteria bacterium]|nr:holo-ACP synthase [Gammaproteobacteria bacterium]NIR85700.1 holo-ACP synthase [Gammaproteobacteria bacterium]NIR90233.1 holo-ACP synthase [Gammaproteobacteria bacterium]NIU06834.1 holo-ACP synthase [Gammaproteobacteria bacterium]NIV53767.1 holo-ACP synthase [Gammaproteobacteria bacterium]